MNKNHKTYDGLHCPNCGGEVEIYNNHDGSRNEIYMTVTCDKCNFKGTEIYKLSYLEGEDDTHYQITP